MFCGDTLSVSLCANRAFPQKFHGRKLVEIAATETDSGLMGAMPELKWKRQMSSL